MRHHDLAGAWAWVRTASHGFADAGGAYRLADALYGAAKTIVWAPYLYEADARKLLGQFVLGLLPLTALTVGAWLHPHRPRGLAMLPAALWALPYAALGVAFFASDSERWIFLLPVGWMVAAALLCRSQHAVTACAVTLLYVLLLNLVAADRAGLPATPGCVADRAERSSALFADGDLVIFPGHGWDECVALSSHAVVPLPLAYYVARDGAPSAWERVRREETSALAAGHHVWVLRVYDEHDDDARGFDELAQLGLDRAGDLSAQSSCVVFTRGTCWPLLTGIAVVRLDLLPAIVHLN